MTTSPLKKASFALTTAAVVATFSAGPALAESVLGDRTRSWFPKVQQERVVSEKPGKLQSSQFTTRQQGQGSQSQTPKQTQSQQR